MGNNSHKFVFSTSCIGEILSYEKQLRLNIDNKILQSRAGKLVQIVTAILAGLSSLVYVSLRYMANGGHVHLRDWYDYADKIICTIIMSIYMIKLYVSQHRYNEIFSNESVMNICIFLPILAIPQSQMNMMSTFYIFIGISRYIRTAYFFVIMFRYYDIGEGEIDRQLNVIGITLLEIVIIFSGIFIETENWFNLDEIVYDYVEGGREVKVHYLVS